MSPSRQSTRIPYSSRRAVKNNVFDVLHTHTHTHTHTPFRCVCARIHRYLPLHFGVSLYFVFWSAHCETLPRVLCAVGSTLRQSVLLQCCRLPHYARDSETVVEWRRMWWRIWWRLGSLSLTTCVYSMTHKARWLTKAGGVGRCGKKAGGKRRSHSGRS